jgi:hypothetical protein
MKTEKNIHKTSMLTILDKIESLSEKVDELDTKSSYERTQIHKQVITNKIKIIEKYIIIKECQISEISTITTTADTTITEQDIY